MFEAFQLPFFQRGLLEILILAVPAGLLGTWIVLRGLAFFSHAVGTAAFPGLVLADGLGFAAPLGALAAALVFTVGNSLLGRRGEESGSAVAIVLVGCLAGGTLLASDVFGSGANVDTLLFGSLLLVDGRDIALAAVVSVVALSSTLLLGERWLASGFDPESSPPPGKAPDAALLVLVALAVTAALTVVGALLVSALFVVPALTARLFTERMPSWQLASVALVAVEGVAGLWLSVETDAPPGATIAVVSGAVFALVAGGRALARSRRRAPVGALAVLAALAAGASLAGCGGSSSSEGKLRVVATTTQVGDFVRAVGGDAVTVDQVLRPNTDPHEYEPRPSDVLAVADADLVFASGDGLDDWIGQVVSDSASDATVVDLGAAVPERRPGESSGGEASRWDPHWWHDPRNAEAAVAEIEHSLAAADPSRRRLFARSAQAYEAKLRELDAGIARCIAAVPRSRRKLVTDHDAFGYFAARYGIDVVGAVLPSQATQAQPSAKDLSELAHLIEREGVTAIFPESSLSASVAKAIAAQTGVTAEYSLYGDTLGGPGSSGATYLSMEAANADAMVRGFSEGRRRCRPLR